MSAILQFKKKSVRSLYKERLNWSWLTIGSQSDGKMKREERERREGKGEKEQKREHQMWDEGKRSGGGKTSKRRMAREEELVREYQWCDFVENFSDKGFFSSPLSKAWDKQDFALKASNYRTMEAKDENSFSRFCFWLQKLLLLVGKDLISCKDWMPKWYLLRSHHLFSQHSYHLVILTILSFAPKSISSLHSLSVYNTHTHLISSHQGDIHYYHQMSHLMTPFCYSCKRWFQPHMRKGGEGIFSLSRFPVTREVKMENINIYINGPRFFRWYFIQEIALHLIQAKDHPLNGVEWKRKDRRKSFQAATRIAIRGAYLEMDMKGEWSPIMQSQYNQWMRLKRHLHTHLISHSNLHSCRKLSLIKPHCVCVCARSLIRLLNSLSNIWLTYFGTWKGFEWRRRKNRKYGNTPIAYHEGGQTWAILAGWMVVDGEGKLPFAIAWRWWWKRGEGRVELGWLVWRKRREITLLPIISHPDAQASLTWITFACYPYKSHFGIIDFDWDVSWKNEIKKHKEEELFKKHGTYTNEWENDIHSPEIQMGCLIFPKRMGWLCVDEEAQFKSCTGLRREFQWEGQMKREGSLGNQLITSHTLLAYAHKQMHILTYT